MLGNTLTIIIASHLEKLKDTIYDVINLWDDYIVDLYVDDVENTDVHMYWSDNNSKDHSIEKYKVIFPELESYEYQKDFLEETPEDYEFLEIFGVHPDIKNEFDYLWDAETMGLM